MAKLQRIAVFFGRLTEAPAASTGAEAFAQITAIFVAVEDELCTDLDDRMYPPSGDFISRSRAATISIFTAKRRTTRSSARTARS